MQRKFGSIQRVSYLPGVAVFLTGLLFSVVPVHPATFVFSQTNPITIPSSGPATAYPSTITVSGVPGAVSKVTVTLSRLNHTWPDDLDILLVGPSGQTVMLMSDAGGLNEISEVTLVFDESAVVGLPDSALIFSGILAPTAYDGGDGDAFPAPAPLGPYGMTLSVFNGINPNGAWRLFVVDDASGDSGNIAGGWRLTISDDVQPSNLPREDFWAPNGPVYAIAETNGTIYLGGNFNYVGPSDGGGVAIDVTSGAPDLDYPKVDGRIWSVVSDGKGGQYIGGAFTNVGGVFRTNLVHILADKTVDAVWRPDLPGVGFTLALSGNVLYVGGFFASIAGVPRANLAALDADTGSVKPWNPIADGPVYTLAISGNAVYVGGAFTTVRGQLRNNIAALDAATGGVFSWNPSANGVVRKLAVVGDNVYATGDFTIIAARVRLGIAAVDAISGVASDWSPTVDNWVTALTVTCDTVYIGGYFTLVNGQARFGLAALDAGTGDVKAWNARLVSESFTGVNALISSLTVVGNKVYVAGDFSSVGGQLRNGVAALDATTGDATEWNPKVGRGLVYALSVGRDSVYIGGDAMSIGGQPRNNLAALDAVTGKLKSWNPNVRGGPVYALAAAGNSVYAGGAFTNVAGVTRTAIAAMDANTGNPTGWAPNANSNVFALAVSGNRVYAGGDFTIIGGFFRDRIAALNTTVPGIAVADWYPGANSTVGTLAVSGNRVYAGGDFTFIGGNIRYGIAAVDTASPGYAVFDWYPGADSTVHTLVVSGSRVYAGGNFTIIGGDYRNGIAALDTAAPGYAVPDWYPYPGVDQRVRSVAVTSDAVFAGGDFTFLGGEQRFGGGAVDPVTGSVTSWNPNFSGSVYALAVARGTVYAGGVFLWAGQAYQYHPAFVAFPPIGSPVLVTKPRQQTVRAGQTLSLNAEATGQTPLFYQWRVNGTNLAGATNALLTIPNSQPSHSGIYDLVVSNSVGLVFSREVSVIAFTVPVITVQPLGQIVNPGATVTLSVTASGSPSPSYQWRLNGVNIPGEISSSLTISNAQPMHGGNYSVVVANVGGVANSQVARLVVTSPSLPFADNFAVQAGTNSASGVGSGSNTAATREAGEPRHAGKPGGKSVWHRWTAPAGGIATFSTRGSGFDTLLAVYTNATVSGTNVVAADDDSRGGFLTSRVAFNAVAGTAYSIVIDGFGGASGDIVLGWNLDTTISAQPRILAQPLSQTVSPGTNATFRVVVSSSTPESYQWFFNCALIPFATNATYIVSNVRSTQVGSYTVRVSNSTSRGVESLPAFLEIGPAKDVLSQDKLQDLLEPGSSSPLPQSVTQRTTPQATPARGYSGTQIFSTFGATKQEGETNHCGIPGGASQWFSYQAEADGTLNLNTDGSDFDTVLAVYTGPGTDFQSLVPVVCDDNSGFDGQDSSVNFTCSVGTIYWIAVDGVNGAQGTIKLNWTLGAPPGMTFQPVRRAALLGGSITLSGETGGTPAPVYQWEFKGTRIAEATNATLVLANYQAANAGQYSVIVSNALGVVTNIVADLHVLELGSLTRATNGALRLRVTGEAGRSYVIEAATNLLNSLWLPLSTNQATNGVLDLIDAQAPSQSRRFYRAVLVP